jgi:predicted dehydrogenase
MQIFGSKGWVEVGDVEHLATWEMKYCAVDPANLLVHGKPQVLTFPALSTERAELEHFARAAQAKRPLAIAGGDEQHNVVVFEAILKSAKSGKTVRLR